MAETREALYMKLDRNLVQDVDLLAGVLNLHRVEAIDKLLREALSRYRPVLEKAKEAREAYTRLSA